MTVVTNLSQLEQKYLNYAVARTGVSLPNCFTYSTARVSQAVGHNQALDGAVRAVGAGQLLERHAPEFVVTDKPVVGSLAIFKNAWYGHVANVEVVGVNMMISESNLGDYGAGYFRCVEMSYRIGSAHPCDSGTRLAGFLTHKDLLKAPQPPKERHIGVKAHVQDIGWMPLVWDGVAGTTGKSKRLEAIQIQTCDGTVIEKVQVHIQDLGWIKPYKYPSANTIMGTTGKSLRMEAVKIKTSKPCKMRVHIQDKGWLDWVDCDGEAIAGTTGKSMRMEAIEIKRK